MVTIDVQGQIMKAICCDSIVADSINMLEIKFNFSGEWNGMTKTAQFTQGEEGEKPTTYNVLIDENGLADVPNEIKAGTVYVGVFGVLGSQRMTTAPLALLVKKSSFVGDGETPIPPTPDLYQQLVMQVINTAGSPVIGENGNWFLDNQDTGVKADWSAEQENAASSAAAAEAAAAQAKAVQDSLPPEYGELAALVNQKAPAIYVDASGDMVHITDGAEGMPVQRLITHVEPVQEGSGDPGPDNVRPISGWDAVTAQATGANLLDINAIKSQYIEISGNTITVTPASGTAVQSSNKIKDILPNAKAGMVVTLSGETDGMPRLYIYDNQYLWNFGSSLTLTTAILNSSFYLYGKSDGSAATITDLQIEVGSVATAYEPYQGQTLTAELPETLYGFDKNWTTGELRKTYHKIVFDGVTNGKKVNSTDGKRLTYAYVTANNLTTKAKAKGKAAANKGVASIATTGSLLVHLPQDVTGVQDGDTVSQVTAKFNAVLAAWYEAGEPLEVVYEIATPTVTLQDPQQLSTLKGVNNIWSNAGATEVTYAADTKLYIDQKIAAIAAAMLNN